MESIPLTGHGPSDFPALFKFSGKDFPIFSFRIRVLAHERSVSHFLELSREAFFAEKTSISLAVDEAEAHVSRTKKPQAVAPIADFNNKNGILASILITHLDDSIIRLLHQCVPEMQELDGNAIWVWLKGKYQPSSAFEVQQRGLETQVLHVLSSKPRDKRAPLSTFIRFLWDKVEPIRLHKRLTNSPIALHFFESLVVRLLLNAIGEHERYASLLIEYSSKLGGGDFFPVGLLDELKRRIEEIDAVLAVGHSRGDGTPPSRGGSRDDRRGPHGNAGGAHFSSSTRGQSGTQKSDRQGGRNNSYNHKNSKASDTMQINAVSLQPAVERLHDEGVQQTCTLQTKESSNFSPVPNYGN